MFTLRPQLGFGDAHFHATDLPAGASSPDSTTWYIEPGVTGLVAVGPLFLGADANALLLAIGQPQMALVFELQVGVKL